MSFTLPDRTIRAQASHQPDPFDEFIEPDAYSDTEITNYSGGETSSHQRLGPDLNLPETHQVSSGQQNAFTLRSLVALSGNLATMNDVSSCINPSSLHFHTSEQYMQDHDHSEVFKDSDEGENVEMHDAPSDAQLTHAFAEGMVLDDQSHNATMSNGDHDQAAQFSEPQHEASQFGTMEELLTVETLADHVNALSRNKHGFPPRVYLRNDPMLRGEFDRRCGVLMTVRGGSRLRARYGDTSLFSLEMWQYLCNTKSAEHVDE